MQTSRPPRDHDTEALAIGCALAFPETLDDFITLSGPAFDEPYHRAVAEGIRKIFTEYGNVEPLRLHQWLKKHKDTDAARAIEYQSRALSPATMETCVEELRRLALLRAVNAAGRRMIQDSLSDDIDIVEIVQNVGDYIDSLATSETEGMEPLSEVAKQQVKLYLVDEQPKGIPTGLDDLDYVWGGFYPGELTVLAARSSMGKSALAQYMAEQVAQRTKKAVVIYSLEMSRGYLADRFIAGEMGLGVDSLRRGYAGKAQLINMGDKIIEGLEPWQHIYLDDTANLTSFDILTRTRRLKRKVKDLGLVVVDYLTLLGDTRGKSESRHHQIDEATRRLRMMAQTLEVPVLVLAQLNRGVELRSDKMPTMSDLRESGGIEEAADSVLLLYREEYYNPLTEKDKNKLEIHVAKQRQGPRGVVVEVYFDATKGKFANLATKGVPDEWL